jgi:hypothetical protein
VLRDADAGDGVSDLVSQRGKKLLRKIGNAQLIITTLCAIPSMDVGEQPASQGIDEWHYLTHTFDCSARTMTIAGLSRTETGDILVQNEFMCTPSDGNSSGALDILSLVTLNWLF